MSGEHTRSKDAPREAEHASSGEQPKGAERVASFIRKNYSYMVLSMVFLGILTGSVAPTQVQSLKPFMLPLTGIMVWAMTVTIKFSELAQSGKKVKQIILALLFCYVFFPIISFALAISFLSSKPEWAIGFILMGSVPTAGMNVVWTGMLKGDLPLSIILNAIMMFLGIITIPTITALFAGVWVKVSMVDLLWAVLTNLVLPLFFGFLTRYALEALSKKKPTKIPSDLFFHLRDHSHGAHVLHGVYKHTHDSSRALYITPTGASSTFCVPVGLWATLFSMLKSSSPEL
jgi:ACR3 family arsenite efflux pump ArsB